MLHYFPLLFAAQLGLGRGAPAHARISVRDGVAVGHVSTWRIGGRELNATTLSLRPLAFEIDDYLTGEECASLRRAATPSLKQSATQQGGAAEAQAAPIDADGDGRLSAAELRLTLDHWHAATLSPAQVLAMAEELELLSPKQRRLARGGGGGGLGARGLSLKKVGSRKVRAAIAAWVAALAQRAPLVRNRLSRQAWLRTTASPPPVLEALRGRLVELTGLPEALLGEANTELQVLSYGRDGHYHHHHDSTALSPQPCCHVVGSSGSGNCKACRFATVLYYLNDGAEGGGSERLAGGETAFPVAGRTGDFTGDASVLDWHLGPSSHSGRYCAEGGGALRVTPKRGKAVLFYNHELDEQAGWKGQIDWFSMHAACPVRAGTKWLANHWVMLADDPRDEGPRAEDPVRSEL